MRAEMLRAAKRRADMLTYWWQRPLCFTGNSTGQLPSAISGTGPFVGPPESNRLCVFCGLGGADALLDALLLEGLLLEELLGEALLDAALLDDVLLDDVLLGAALLAGTLFGATLLAAMLPLVPYA
jgi:hypothetical protein